MATGDPAKRTCMTCNQGTREWRKCNWCRKFYCEECAKHHRCKAKNTYKWCERCQDVAIFPAKRLCSWCRERGKRKKKD